MLKGNFNNVLFQMFHLRNKSHLSNSKASRLAFQSNLIADNTMGAFLAADNLSKEEKAKQDRDIANRVSVGLQNGIKELHSLTAIKEDDLKKIGSASCRILIGKTTGIAGTLSAAKTKLGLSTDEKNALESLGDYQNLSATTIFKHFK